MHETHGHVKATEGSAAFGTPTDANATRDLEHAAKAKPHNTSGNHLAFRKRQCQPGATPLRGTNPTMRICSMHPISNNTEHDHDCKKQIGNQP
jgi:hypothetical protein